jgi:hypothetical protein
MTAGIHPRKETYSRHYPLVFRLAVLVLFGIILWALVSEVIDTGFTYLLAFKAIAVMFCGLWIWLGFWFISFPKVGFQDDRLIIKKISGTTSYPLEGLRLGRWKSLLFHGLEVRLVPESKTILRFPTRNIHPFMPNNAGGYASEFVDKLKGCVQELES